MKCALFIRHRVKLPSQKCRAQDYVMDSCSPGENLLLMIIDFLANFVIIVALMRLLSGSFMTKTTITLYCKLYLIAVLEWSQEVAIGR